MENQVPEPSSTPDAVRLCPNCGTRYRGRFCAVCGQESEPEDSLASFTGDVFQSLTDTEGRFLQTLRELAVDPGNVTRRYIDGERKRWTSPVSIFLAGFFALFLAIDAFGFDIVEFHERSSVGPALANADSALSAIAEGRTRRISPVGEFWMAFQEGYEQRTSPKNPLEMTAERSRAQAALAEVRAARQAWTGGAGAVPADVKPLLRADPALINEMMQEAVSKYSFLLIPLSLPFMMLLFVGKSGVHSFDHAIFVTYSIGFASLALSVVIVLAALGLPLELLLYVFAAGLVWHHFRQLRGAYRLALGGALVRTLVLEIFVAAILFLFMLFLAVVGAFG